MKVGFIHPHLGMGGAEKLIVSAILGTRRRKHSVAVFTNSYDPDYCFKETKQFKKEICVVGAAIPDNIMGKFHLFFSILKLTIMSLYVSLFKFDTIVCDISPIPILILRPIYKILCRKTKIFYYCHTPEQLDYGRKGNFLRYYYATIYRYLEEAAVSRADKVAVNSKYILEVFHRTFPNVKRVPVVLYPGTVAENSIENEKENYLAELQKFWEDLKKKQKILLSINRFDEKKNLKLALETLSLLKSENEFKTAQLILAGGFDRSSIINTNCYSKLIKECKRLNLTTSAFPDLSADVIFLKGFNDIQKRLLLKIASCVLYTPPFEHFGIVPLEAMNAEVPVIAVNFGGPTETIVHEKTGFLCENSARSFSDAVKVILRSPENAKLMGEEGRAHVQRNFSDECFEEGFENILKEIYTE